MGNFYTNVTLPGASFDSVVDVMRSLNRDAHVDGDGKVVIVYDRLTDEQDTEILAALAERLATDTNGIAFAVLNHDDDILWFQLYRRDVLVAEYASEGGPRTAVRAMGRTLGCPSAALRLWYVLHRPYVFQIDRHEALNRIIGFPEATLLGFTYIDRGERTDDMSQGRIIRLSR